MLMVWPDTAPDGGQHTAESNIHGLVDGAALTE